MHRHRCLMILSLCSGCIFLSNHLYGMPKSHAKKMSFYIELVSLPNSPQDIFVIAAHTPTKELFALVKKYPQLQPILEQRYKDEELLLEKRHKEEGLLLVEAIKSFIQKENDMLFNKICTLIANKAYIEIVDEDDKTPLMLAAEGGKIRIVRLLIAAGANPNRVNKNWESAEELARANGHSEVFVYLKKCSRGFRLKPEDSPMANLLRPITASPLDLYLDLDEEKENQM